jgi:hypothetical protein
LTFILQSFTSSGRVWLSFLHSVLNAISDCQIKILNKYLKRFDNIPILIAVNVEMRQNGSEKIVKKIDDLPIQRTLSDLRPILLSHVWYFDGNQQSKRQNYGSKCSENSIYTTLKELIEWYLKDIEVLWKLSDWDVRSWKISINYVKKVFVKWYFRGKEKE